MDDLRYNVIANYSDDGMSCVVKMAKIYYKITHETENHHGFQYKDGLNEDTVPFSKKGSCVPGGLYFTDAENILEYISYGPWIREVTIPDDAEMVKDPQGDKWRASKIILGKRRNLKLPETWKWMKSVGIKNFPITWIVQRGQLELFDATFENPTETELSTGFDLAVYFNQFKLAQHLIDRGAQPINDVWYNTNGSLASLRFLISLGLDINSVTAHGRFIRSLNGSKKILKNMIRLGCNPKDRMLEVLWGSIRTNDTSLVKYMVKHGFDFKLVSEADWVHELGYANPSMRAYLNTLRP